MTDERIEQLYGQLRSILRQLDAELNDEEVDTALARLLVLAQREKRLSKVWAK